MKLFISSDIEGVAGISSWEEARKEIADYEYYARQMSLETAAAAEAALKFSAQVLVRDAHGTARNMKPDLFPEGVEFIRNWSGDPRRMMDGIDESFTACLMIGYHSEAGSGGNPLAHSYRSALIYELRVNGELVSECEFNTMIAAYYGVPLLFLSGDESLCNKMKGKIPQLTTVATSVGTGASSRSIHPKTAVKRIFEGVETALQAGIPEVIALPEKFNVEVGYKEHSECYMRSFYPGAKRKDSRTIAYETKDFYEVMRFLQFVC